MIYIRLLYKLCGAFQVETLQGSRVNAVCSVCRAICTALLYCMNHPTNHSFCQFVFKSVQSKFNRLIVKQNLFFRQYVSQYERQNGKDISRTQKK